MNLKKIIIAFLALVTFKTNVSNAQAPESIDSLNMESYFKDLPEVLVEGQRPIAKMERGKLIFDMKVLQRQMPAENAFELISRIPGVVKQGGAFSIGGQSATLIINGRVTTLDNEQIEELLQSMPSDMIKYVEIMQAAPAQYHIRGAIINILTNSKKKDESLTGQIQGAWNHSEKSLGYGKGALHYGDKKFNFDVIYSHTNGWFYSKSETDAVHLLTNGSQIYNDLIENNARTISHNYYVGADFLIAENNTVSLSYSGKYLSSHNNSNASGSNVSEQNSITHNYLNNINLQYSAPFGLNIGASFLKFKYPQDQNFTDNGTSNKSNVSESGQNITKWLFTADQTHTLPKAWGMSYGAKYQLTNNDSWQTMRNPSGVVIVDGTSRVNYTERIFSSFLSLNKSWGNKVSLEVGAEIENYHTPQINDWKVYPSVNLFFMINNSNLFNLSFSSSSVYPSYWSTMSSVFYSSSYKEIWGNPNLKPAHHYNINLMWRFKQNYTINLFAKFLDDYFTQLAYQPQDRMALILQEINFDYRNIIGTQVSTRFSFGQFLNGNLMGTLYYTHDKCSDFFDLPFNREILSGNISATVVIPLWFKRNLLLILNPYYQFGAIQGTYDINDFFILSSSIRWSSNNSRWSLSASCNNITDSHTGVTSVWNNQNIKMKYWNNKRTFGLTVTYKFGKYQDKQQKEVDVSRMGH